MANVYNKENEMDYDETVLPIARLEIRRRFHASASFMGVMSYQMAVRCAFLNYFFNRKFMLNKPPILKI